MVRIPGGGSRISMRPTPFSVQKRLRSSRLLPETAARTVVVCSRSCANARALRSSFFSNSPKCKPALLLCFFAFLGPCRAADTLGPAEVGFRCGRYLLLGCTHERRFGITAVAPGMRVADPAEANNGDVDHPVLPSASYRTSDTRAPPPGDSSSFTRTPSPAAPQVRVGAWNTRIGPGPTRSVLTAFV